MFRNFSFLSLDHRQIPCNKIFDLSFRSPIRLQTRLVGFWDVFVKRLRTSDQNNLVTDRIILYDESDLLWIAQQRLVLFQILKLPDSL